MRVCYERWRHKALNELYVVQLQEGRVTGIVGPLAGAAPGPAALPHMAYDEDPERCRGLQERESEFLLVK